MAKQRLTERRDRNPSQQAPLSITSTPQNIVPALLLLTNHPNPLQLLITSYNSFVNTMEIVLRLGTLVSFDSMIDLTTAAVANSFVVMFVPSIANLIYTISPF